MTFGINGFVTSFDGSRTHDVRRQWVRGPRTHVMVRGHMYCDHSEGAIGRPIELASFNLHAIMCFVIACVQAMVASRQDGL